MALKPSNDDPNHDAEVKRHQANNSDWGGDDLKKGLPVSNPQTQQAPAITGQSGMKK